MTGQSIITSARGRAFAGSPLATLAFIVDQEERILMLRNPKSEAWEVINGAFEANESLLDGLLREIHEEAGPEVQVRPLGVFHAYTFPYDHVVTHMISLCWVVAYDGGAVMPGDDMQGSDVRWFSVDELESGDYSLIAPSGLPWIFRRCIECYHLWRDTAAVELQPSFDASTAKPKYGKA